MEVLIIDDQQLFADGICCLLKDYDPHISTAYAPCIDTALDKIANKGLPKLILLSINDQNAKHNYNLISRLDVLNLAIPVVVISANGSSTAAGIAIENNASGFISKSCGREVTLEAIESVLNGSVYVRKPKTEAVEAEAIDCDKITNRQQEVLLLLSKGLVNKQIARELDISANTVKTHLHDLFRLLRVSNRTAAVRSGQKYGLI